MARVLRIWWVRVLIAGFLAELTLIVVILPVYFLPDRDTVLLYVTPPASVVVFVAAGYLATRTAVARQALFGALVGVVAVALYLGPIFAARAAGVEGADAPLPLAYHITNGLKILGGAAGGWLAARRAQAAP